jgi:hypothetical protein
MSKRRPKRLNDNWWLKVTINTTLTGYPYSITGAITPNGIRYRKHR